MRKASALLAKNFKSTFLSCETDQETIWRRLFVESRPYSDKLKKLLVINTADCLDEEQIQYQEIIDGINLDFIPTGNPHYRDCTITFSIICHLDYWELDDYKLRPYQIAGYIDGMLNETKLSGIGTLQFMGASEIIMNEYLGGIMLRYSATHGRGDDSTTVDPELPAPQDLGGGAW